jgi:predicted ester cyclase
MCRNYTGCVQGDLGLSLEENKALIRRYFEAIDAACASGNADVLDEFVAPDFVTHNPFPGMAPGIEGAKRLFLMFVAAAPGRHVVEDLIADGDKVVGRITAYGTHEGELLGIARTGKPMRMTGITVWRIANGKIMEHWSEMDTLGLLQQLGAFTMSAPKSI